MKNATVFLVHLPDAARSVAQEAARALFDEVDFIAAPTVAEAMRATVRHPRQVLILTDESEDEIGRAAQAADRDHQPRWAVVALGENPSDLVESVPWADCTAPGLARIMRFVLQQHDLVCENLRLRGDLKTVAHRFRHDLLGTLNCINVSCELIQELLNGRARPVKAQLGVIRSSLSETCQLIDHVSEVLDASAEPVPLRPVAMATVIETVVRRLAEDDPAGAERIRRPPDWPVVEGSAPWLEAIWRHLIRNALKHGEPAAPIELGWDLRDAATRFWVANRGAELPADLANRLFRPFDHLHGEPGRGFGLAIVNRLVSLQGGRCGYERRSGQSTVFTFTLPRRSAAPPGLTPANPETVAAPTFAPRPRRSERGPRRAC